MKVMVIVKASKASESGEMPSEELMTAMGKFNEELADADVMLAGEGLHPSSKGVRVHFSGKNRTVTDGPFAETKELIAGYWIWKVESMEEAVEWAKRCPNPHVDDCHIEIRPIFSAEDFGEAFTPELREQEAAIRAQALGLSKPRFENGRELLIAGLNESYTPETRENIPEQWTKFSYHFGKIPDQSGQAAYGVCWNFKDGCKFDYLAGVEVNSADNLPEGFAHVRLPARRYAVFTHDKHVSEIPKTMDTIGAKWMPDCEVNVAHAPCFERYSEEFNPHTGMAGIEIWVPLES